ncbi:hypothetical protein Taro_055360 [Colocasia esculenta]|uniref:Uncharacterized protein n=1 Tax=Colocasia esculenta TaxID=4460 RepID=A0A843XTE6_COLES|nr:hypothetical protein [Colocasia esculenta]
MRVATGSTEIATGSGTGRDSLIGSGRALCHEGLVNAAYRAIAFTGSAPSPNRERTLHWIAGQNLPYLIQGYS